MEHVTAARERWWSRAASSMGGYKVLVLWLLPPVAVICGSCALAVLYASRLGLEGTAAGMLVFVLAMSQTYAFIGSLGWIIKMARWFRRAVKKAEPTTDKALDWWMGYLQEKFGSPSSQPEVE